jgi:hypothetical protein
MATVGFRKFSVEDVSEYAESEGESTRGFRRVFGTLVKEGRIKKIDGKFKVVRKKAKVVGKPKKLTTKQKARMKREKKKQMRAHKKFLAKQKKLQASIKAIEDKAKIRANRIYKREHAKARKYPKSVEGKMLKLSKRARREKAHYISIVIDNRLSEPEKVADIFRKELETLVSYKNSPSQKHLYKATKASRVRLRKWIKLVKGVKK